jgi:hypothetical protein
MKASKGKANPATLNDLLKQKLAGWCDGSYYYWWSKKGG